MMTRVGEDVVFGVRHPATATSNTKTIGKAINFFIQTLPFIHKMGQISDIRGFNTLMLRRVYVKQDISKADAPLFMWM
jgi:hypothetical protein